MGEEDLHRSDDTGKVMLISNSNFNITVENHPVGS